MLGTLSRYILAAVSCVCIAQFLLLLNVSTENAGRLAGQSLGRGIVCGLLAGVWFYGARKTHRLGQPQPESDTHDKGQTQLVLALTPEAISESTPAGAPTVTDKLSGSFWKEHAGGLIVVAFLIYCCVQIVLGAQKHDDVNSYDALFSKCGPSNTNRTDRAMDHCDDTPKLAPEKRPESTNNSSPFEDSVAASEKEQISAILALTPDKLIIRCGPPLTDRTKKWAENSDVRFLSYTDVYGRPITLAFSGPQDIYLQYGDRKVLDPIIEFRLDPPVYAEKYALRAAYMLPCAAKP